MENITLEKALEVVYKKFYKEDKIRVFGMNKNTIDILLSLGSEEFLKKFENHYRRYITDEEIKAISTVVSLFLDCDRGDIAMAIEDFEHNLNFDDNNRIYYDLRKEE